MVFLPSLRRLAIFDAVMRDGSTGAAAQRIGLSQPAVSHAISKLEIETGVKLLDRGSGGSYGTDAGRLLHRRVERMLRQIEQGIYGLTRDAGHDAAEIQATSRRLTTTQIRCHMAIAEHGSFRAAARHLGIAEPTLHRTARDFERSLRIALYRRDRHGMASTQSGILFANGLRLALREIDQALAEIAAEQGVAEGRISVGTLPMMPKQLLARAVGRMLRRHPSVEIEIEEGSREFLVGGLRDGTVDVLVGALRGEERDGGLVESPLFDDPYVIVARAGHILARAGAIADSDLADYGWVIPTRTMPRHAALETLFARLPRRPRVALETSSLAMTTSTLVESDCLSLLSRSQAQMSAADSGIAVLAVGLSGPRRLVGATTRAGWLPTRVQRRFLTILRQECRGMDVR